MSFVDYSLLLIMLSLAVASGALFLYLSGSYKRWFYLAYSAGFILAAIGLISCPICTVVGWSIVLSVTCCWVAVKFVDEYSARALRDIDAMHH